jgi:ATP-dependent RNA helicase DDX56/DBP9
MGECTNATTADSITMKRKLDSNDVPSTEPSAEKETTRGMFEDLKLDPRLLQAVSKEKYLQPTPVQASVIPLALQGRDILGLWTASPVGPD